MAIGERTGAALGGDPRRARLAGAVVPYALRHTSIVRGIRSNLPVRLVAASHDTAVSMIEAHYAEVDRLRSGGTDTAGDRAAGAASAGRQRDRAERWRVMGTGRQTANWRVPSMRDLVKGSGTHARIVQDAVGAYRKGDPSRFADCVLALDRHVLAVLARRWDRYDLATSREEIWVAAAFARNLYDLWRNMNKEEGVRDYRRHEWMKNDAVNFIFEDFFPWLTEDDWHKIRDRIDRPRSPIVSIK